MTVRLAINGLGRTGRSFLGAALTSSHEFEIVAVNDLGNPEALARLLARDSVHGRYPEPVHVDGDTMVHGHLVKVLGWHDNESGYSSRLADLAAIVGAAPGS
jgi:glyceraldehyde 3-phosphate dehydrogenase